VAPVILGVILGPLMDVSYRRAMISARNDHGTFIIEFLNNPLSLALTVYFLFILVSQTPLWRRLTGRTKVKADA
jgi:putative tricarboxylic transport membrane protein